MPRIQPKFAGFCQGGVALGARTGNGTPQSQKRAE